MTATQYSIWHKINFIYLVFILGLGIFWLARLHTFGISIGMVAVVTAYFIYQCNRWAYFVAAVLCFGLLRTAMDDGYGFHQGFQSIAKLVYIIGLVFAFILHEKVGKKNKLEKSNTETHSPD
jgi:hypothetical protein